MNKLIVFAALLAGFVSTAAAQSRTVCVLRNRPVAIHPVPRPVVHRHCVAAPVNASSVYTSNAGHYNYGYINHGAVGGRFFPRVPAVYGYINPRLHYVSPCRPNGYVGVNGYGIGLQNIQSHYIQIPPSFTRAPQMPSRPSAMPPPRPAPHAGGK